MNRRALIGITAGLMLSPIGWANDSQTAVERTVWGQVTGVESIATNFTTSPDPDCGGPRPTDASLAELLQWDLHPDCRAARHQEVIGYRVHYTWDGRTYTVEMQQQPGPRIPLRLRIR